MPHVGLIFQRFKLVKGKLIFNKGLRTFKAEKNCKCSLTVNLSNKTFCCGQRPRLRLILSISVSMLCPLINAVPLVGGNNPVSIDIVVVFPFKKYHDFISMWWYGTFKNRQYVNTNYEIVMQQI